MVSDDRVVVVAFRGTPTDQLVDVLADLDMRQTRAANGGKVHAGFARAYSFVRNRVRELVAAHRTGEQTLWVTGHSLGGSLAVLAGSELTEQGPRVNGVYTFGQPRVGDAAFVSELDKDLGQRCFRLVKNFCSDPFANHDAVVREKAVVSPKKVGGKIEGGTKSVGKRLEKVFGK